MKKRSSGSPVSDLSRPVRKRALSEEERTLWESVAKQVKPLRKKLRPAKSSAAENSTRQQRTGAPTKAFAQEIPSAAMSRPSKPIAPPLVPLGRRERSKLSRGRSEIDARLDLHGMTQVHAHRALLGFLQRAHRDGLSFVLVITGKGNIGGDGERGILRRQVPQWLGLPEFRPLIVGFDQAHVGHGGAGALYVRIRRVRD
jgi:DNA-nicking Smr family endonuclease